MARGWLSRRLSDGEDPDPRFTFANERTFLAWTRTSLALVAAGVGVEALTGDALPPVVRKVLAVILILLGGTLAVGSFLRWVGAEQAMRRREHLPSPALAVPLVVGMAIICAALVVVVLVAGDR